MSNLSITNVINVTVSSPPSGLADYQVNNLAIFTKETPINETLGPVGGTAATFTTTITDPDANLKFTAANAGVAGNDITVEYVDPEANDQALAVTVTGTAISVSLATGVAGAITTIATDIIALIAGDSDAAALVSAAVSVGDGTAVVTAVAATNLTGGRGDGVGIYVSPADVAADWGTTSEAYSQAVAVFSQTPNILNGDGSLVICPMAADETLTSAITARLPQQFFGGALPCGYDANDAEFIAASATCESLRVKLFIGQYLLATLTPTTGLFAVLSASAVPHSRMLLYTQGGTLLNARNMAAAYASRAMSVDFNGSNTTNTMQLKQLATVTVDNGINQATLDTCKTLGVDTYVPIAGRPSVFSTGGTTGGNAFFDEVYNLDWLVLAMGVAGFNALATTSTKVPQTEQGMAVLRGAYLNVLGRSVNNGYVAPGQWNSPELFGDPADLKRNIGEIGFYLYSAPVNSQSQTAREQRKAPLIQVAIKLAGAVHSSDVVVNVNP